MILGCGRSGTSIFGELFEQLPMYEYHSEPEFASVLGLDFAKPIAVKVPKESADHIASPGLSFPLDSMLSIAPKLIKVYWQVRHPLDAVASLKVGISNNWGHHPRPPDWKEWVSRPLIQQCAHHWAYINTVGYQTVEHIAEVCKFEDMLAMPHQFAQKICSDIGVTHADHKVDLLMWSERVQNTNNEKFVEAMTSRSYSTADHKTRVDRWKENLSDDDLRQVIPIVQKASSRFAYELPSCPPK